MLVDEPKATRTTESSDPVDWERRDLFGANLASTLRRIFPTPDNDDRDFEELLRKLG